MIERNGISLIAVLLSAVLLTGIFTDSAAAESSVSLAATEFPPYYGKSLPDQGFISEIIRDAFESVGYRVAISFLPWKRALVLAKSGEYDGIYCGWFRTEREQWFAFSDPLPPNVLGFYSLKRRNIHFDSLDQLHPYTIGVVNAYSYPAAFEKGHFHVEAVSEDRLNILKLFAGRIDLVLIDKIMGQYLIRTYYPHDIDKFEWHEPPLQVENQYLMFSKKAAEYQQKLADFNRGLQQIRESGRIDAIIAKHGFSELAPAVDPASP